MSLSHDFARDEQLVRYLLDLLSEEDTERLDALCLADDEVAGRLQAVENDLVDSYANGSLAGTTLSHFQRVYLTSPRRLEKVRFAQSLLIDPGCTSDLRAPHAGGSLSAHDSTRSMLRRPDSSVPLAGHGGSPAPLLSASRQAVESLGAAPW